MKDFDFFSACDHKVVEIFDIQGSSPNFYVDLLYESNQNIEHTRILEVTEVDGMCFYAMADVGITNFYFSTNRKIIFGSNSIDVGTKFPDPDINYVPQKKYFGFYTSLRSNCPKCHDTGKLLDVQYEGAGRIKVVEGTAKIKQQLVKALLTLQGTNLFDAEYGAGLSNSIGEKIDTYLAARIQFSVLNAINRLMELHIENSVPDNERIVSVSDIDVVADNYDPRNLEIKVIILNGEYEEISSSVFIKI